MGVLGRLTLGLCRCWIWCGSVSLGWIRLGLLLWYLAVDAGACLSVIWVVAGVECADAETVAVFGRET